jgi:hypothetical protein
MPRRVRKVAGGCLVLIAILVIGSFTPFGHAVKSFLPFAYRAILPHEQLTYDATRKGNLHAIYTALMLYEDSEGAFPKDGWMDAIKNYMRTTNMSAEEAAKKLVRPDLVGTKDAFGYAINDAVAGKYHGDVKDPMTVLVFESEDTSRNAHGDTEKANGRMAVTVDGSVVTLK